MTMSNDVNAPVPGVTLVRMNCRHCSIETSVPTDHAQIALNFASVVAQDIRSEGDLVEFIIDQIHGRANPEEAALAQACPGYAEDVARKLAFFALGLLTKRPELTDIVKEALRVGEHSIDIQLFSQRVLVQIDGGLLHYKTSFMIRSDSGLTTALH